MNYKILFRTRTMTAMAKGTREMGAERIGEESLVNVEELVVVSRLDVSEEELTDGMKLMTVSTTIEP